MRVKVIEKFYILNLQIYLGKVMKVKKNSSEKLREGIFGLILPKHIQFIKVIFIIYAID